MKVQSETTHSKPDQCEVGTNQRLLFTTYSVYGLTTKITVFIHSHLTTQVCYMNVIMRITKKNRLQMSRAPKHIPRKTTCSISIRLGIQWTNAFITDGLAQRFRNLGDVKENGHRIQLSNCSLYNY